MIPKDDGKELKLIVHLVRVLTVSIKFCLHPITSFCHISTFEAQLLLAHDLLSYTIGSVQAHHAGDANSNVAMPNGLAGGWRI